MRPHRLQPTRLPRPWDSPGKNTGVSCHFLLQCMKVKSESEVAQSCLNQRLQPTRLLCPWDFPGKSTGVGCCCLLPCFLYNPTDVGNLISGSSAFSKPRLYIWKLLVHVLLKPSLKDFDSTLTCILNEIICTVV